MKLRTEFSPPASEVKLKHHDQLLLVGSCFAQNIGQRLKQAKFQAEINPLGIAFNPLSFNRLIGADESWLTQVRANLHENESGFFNHDLHSSFNQLEARQYLEEVKKAYRLQQSWLQETKYIFISYGTAWVYELEERKLVNNCHKLPASAFNKRLLSIEEIEADFQRLKKTLKKRYQKDYTFLFTISPVRHLKDGFHENQLSKSSLQLAVNQIVSHHTNCHYFPAYELVLDDLRDYRFFEEDMVHPNALAIIYIWQKFQSLYFSEETKRAATEIEKLVKSISHRPFQINSEKHQHFLESLFQKMEEAERKYAVDFGPEKTQIRRDLLSQ